MCVSGTQEAAVRAPSSPPTFSFLQCSTKPTYLSLRKRRRLSPFGPESRRAGSINTNPSRLATAMRTSASRSLRVMVKTPIARKTPHLKASLRKAPRHLSLVAIKGPTLLDPAADGAPPPCANRQIRIPSPPIRIKDPLRGASDARPTAYVNSPTNSRSRQLPLRANSCCWPLTRS